MNYVIKIKDKFYELAASSDFDGSADIYGQTLNEVCQFHENAIRRVQSPELKALERIRYIRFLFRQIMNFDSCDYIGALNRIILLCDCVIDTLSGIEGRDRVHAESIAACRRYRRMMAELLALTRVDPS